MYIISTCSTYPTGVFAGSFLIGVFFGFACALCTKFTAIRDYPLLETTLFFILSYSSFLAAEASNLTGIVAILFCGICQVVSDED